MRVLVLLLILPLLQPAFAQAVPVEPERPNLLYVFSDEHRWQSMPMTELPGLQAPNLERLAAQGMSFERCISNYPVCSPHRAMLMTGRWPYQVRMRGAHPGMIGNNLPLHPGQPTLAKIFREAGYRTAYVGKWHLGGVELEEFGFDFDRVWTGTDNHFHSHYYADGERILSERYNATHMMDQALEYLASAAERPEPFFLMVSMNPPHKDVLDAPPEKLALYEAEGALPRRPNHTQPDRGNPLHGLIREVGEEEAVRRLTERQGAARARRRVTRAVKEMARGGESQESAEVYRGYHAHVSAIDDELGRLLDGLEDLGLAQDTILVYSSDHGSMLGSHGFYKKRFPHEESIRVPFLARWPGRIPAASRSPSLFGTIDVLPTLCGLAGLEVPEDCSGLDFSATLLGGEGPQPESQFLMNIWDQVHRQDESPYYRGVRTTRYTYTETEEGPWLLFDNEADPYQQVNLLEDEAVDGESLEPLRRRLADLTAEWVRSSGDPFVSTGQGDR